MVGQSALDIPIGASGQVWAQSANSINLLFGERVVGIVWKDSLMAPSNILVDAPFHARPSLPVSRTRTGISSRDFTITFAGSETFAGEIRTGKIIEATARAVRKLLATQPRNTCTERIRAAAVRADWAALIGTGPGSTPSGDDFLCGVLAVDRLRGVESNAPDAVSSALSLSPGATTRLGYTMLLDALAGRFSMVACNMAANLRCDFSREFWYNLLVRPSHHSLVDLCDGLLCRHNRRHYDQRI